MTRQPESLKVVLTHGGTVPVSESFQIEYRCPNGRPVELWKREENQLFCMTLLNSPSGSGKTTLLRELYRRLNPRDQREPNLCFDFRPDLEHGDLIAVGFIPQNPPMVNHWRVCDIVPPDSYFFQCLFPEVNNPDKYMRKRLGECSGGQRRRLYACSALDRLAKLKKQSNFLLLDETLDGIGAEGANQCLTAVGRMWPDKVDKPLFLLLVTHLDATALAAAAVNPLNLRLSVTGEGTNDGPVPRKHLSVELFCVQPQPVPPA